MIQLYLHLRSHLYLNHRILLVSVHESPQPVKYSASQIKQEKLFENGVDIDDTDLNLQSTPVL